jgi:hypothetical protein
VGPRQEGRRQQLVATQAVKSIPCCAWSCLCGLAFLRRCCMAGRERLAVHQQMQLLCRRLPSLPTFCWVVGSPPQQCTITTAGRASCPACP